MEHQGDNLAIPGEPRAPIGRLLSPLTHFLHVQAASGIVLLAATATALILANSPLGDAFLRFWKTPVALEIGGFQMRHSLQHWINDGVMAIFFFVIGLEVKRELVVGELSDLRKAALPIAAAVGGMVVPALLYLSLQYGEPAERGWGIPMATDIAFVVGCMAVLGRRVPHGLRVMLLSLAIADDIGAILVIAIGYTDEIHLAALVWGCAGLGVVFVAARVGVRSFLVYTLLGAMIWLFFHESGVHATLAGVVLGLMTPATSYVSTGVFGEILERLREVIHGEWEEQPDRVRRVVHFRRATRELIPPTEFLENLLHPWVAFVIMPIFALANAGVPIRIADLGSPVALAVMLGLAAGKPVGILLFSWLSVKTGLARLPSGVTWSMVGAGGCLAGIGFTMALFIAALALEDRLLDTAKFGVLAGSLLSAAVGMGLFYVLGRKPQAADAATSGSHMGAAEERG